MKAKRFAAATLLEQLKDKEIVIENISKYEYYPVGISEIDLKIAKRRKEFERKIKIENNIFSFCSSFFNRTMY